MSSGTSFEIDTRDFQRALREFTRLSKRAPAEVLRDQARLFVVDAAKLTPPNTGKWNPKGGRATVANDIAKVLAPHPISSGRSAIEIHTRFRSTRGRVQTNLRKGVRDRRYRVPLAELRRLVRQKQGNVGLLASGWNAAAAKLNARLPKWIMKHGTGLGSTQMHLTGEHMFITLSNRVRYIPTVKGLKRSIETALQWRERAMTRQIDFALKKLSKGLFR